jgi:transcriptional regulator with GAF, ATPase, and Fis domain
VEAREGLAEAARGGTLFLNEVGDLPLALQPKLLHFLEHRDFRRVGSTKTVRSDAVIICATNAELERRVAEGSFRRDLFYRMTECVLEVPPLRERVEDIPLLAELFLREFERRSARPRLVLDPLAQDLLMRCAWDGNIRELRACLSRAVDESPSGYIEAHHLDSPSLRRLERAGSSSGVRDEEALMWIRRISEALERTGGIVSRAAALLGLTESALRRRIEKYDLWNLTVRGRVGRRPSISADVSSEPADSG